MPRSYRSPNFAVTYVDYADRDALRRHYANDLNVDKELIPEIDIVTDGKTHSEFLPNQCLDYVVASHVMEHVPDILLLKVSRKSFPFVERAFADSAYNAERVRDATSIAIEIVKKIADQVGFQVLPRRWVVERFFAWINRNRRLAKDFEATNRLGRDLPLRRRRHAPHATAGPISMSFEFGTLAGSSIGITPGGAASVGRWIGARRPGWLRSPNGE